VPCRAGQRRGRGQLPRPRRGRPCRRGVPGSTTR
jgi:hypothetical protein